MKLGSNVSSRDSVIYRDPSTPVTISALVSGWFTTERGFLTAHQMRVRKGSTSGETPAGL